MVVGESQRRPVHSDSGIALRLWIRAQRAGDAAGKSLKWITNAVSGRIRSAPHRVCQAASKGLQERRRKLVERAELADSQSRRFVSCVAQIEYESGRQLPLQVEIPFLNVAGASIVRV